MSSEIPAKNSLWKRLAYKWKEYLYPYLEEIMMTEHTFVIIIAIFIGFLGGFGAVFFRFLIRLFHSMSFGSGIHILEAVQHLPWYERIAIPALGGLLIGPIIYYLAREAKGHGVPEVMEAVVIRNGVIRPRVAIVKAVASSLCIGTGGSVGREGPIVQIGSSIGSTIGQILKVSGRRMRTFVACGAAAGIAATFNAPIAGALFALEIILGDFGLTRFSPVVISSVMATVVSRHYIGNFTSFIVPQYQLMNPLELIFYGLLGILSGIIALTFIKTLYLSETIFEQMGKIDIIKPVIGGLLIGVIALRFPNIFGVGYETINLALHENLSWPFLFMLIFAKLIATSITLGSGGSGGIFAPSLFIGAMTGGAFGTFMHQLSPGLTATAGAYALVGMGGLVAGTTHAPITAILIIFELTNDYKIILPLMITCIISSLLASTLEKESIYTLKLARRGVSLFEGREINILRKIQVSNLLKKVETIPENLSFKSLAKMISSSSEGVFYVTDGNSRFIGIITLKNMSQILKDYEALKEILIARDMISQTFPTLYQDDTLDLAMHIFEREDLDEIPVVDRRDHTRLLGRVKESDIIEAYNREVLKSDTIKEVHRAIEDIDRTRIERLTNGFAMVELPAPPSFTGKNLRELSLRQKYGIQVYMIKKCGGKKTKGEFIEVVPKPDTIIEEGDILLIAGQEGMLKKLNNI